MTDQKERALVLPVRIYLEDTDAGGVVYNSRYLNFFERARTELIRSAGVSHTELKERHRLIWVLLDISVKFLRAARLDDELRVSAELTWMRGVRQGFRHEITRVGDGALLATAEASTAILDADTLKPVRVPAWIREKLENTNNAF